MWLIPMMILLVAVGTVLMLVGKEMLERGRGSWVDAIGGTLLLFSGGGLLVQTFIFLLGI